MYGSRDQASGRERQMVAGWCLKGMAAPHGPRESRRFPVLHPASIQLRR